MEEAIVAATHVSDPICGTTRARCILVGVLESSLVTGVSPLCTHTVVLESASDPRAGNVALNTIE